jgi:hypothetical protein
MHRLDFGLDLEFADEVIGISWSVPGQVLAITPRSLREEMQAAAEQDASMIVPWSRVIGHAVTAVVEREGSLGASGATADVWSVRLEFGAETAIWVAAATFLETLDILVKGGDEVIVVWDGEFASRLEMN